MIKGTTNYRGVILSARQITFIENKKVRSNLELTFKVLQKEVEKEVTNADGTTSVTKVWEDCMLPMFSNDGTPTEGKKITISNSAFSALPILEDPNIGDDVKMKYFELLAETENRPFAVYSNVSAFAKYLLEGRGIIFTRDLYNIGDKFVTPNGVIEAEKQCYQNIISKLAGKMSPIFAKLICSWTGKHYEMPAETTTTATSATNDAVAMFANL